MSGESLRDSLAALLAGGTLRGGAALAARELLTRLDRPLRVCLFGLPGSGRTRLINALAGEALFPGDAALPTLLLSCGPQRAVEAVLADGSRRRWPGLPLDEVLAQGPAMLTVEAPLPALDGISLMRLAADETGEDQQAAMAWAADQCDLALWCSAGFGGAEADLWAAAPARLRDCAWLAAPPPWPEEAGFLAAFDPSDDPAALAGELARHAAEARRHLTDQAGLFLSHYGAARAAPSPARRAPARQPDLQRLYAGAAGLLRDRARDLRDRLPGFGAQPAGPVFDHCLETLESLVVSLEPARSPELSEMVLDVLDSLTLLQGEGGTGQAADGLTLLLQLRRDLEARAAA